jgi:hypothetical protein
LVTEVILSERIISENEVLGSYLYNVCTQAILKFMELHTKSKHCESVVQMRSLPHIPAFGTQCAFIPKLL